jgi:hypothetical protein
MKFAHLLVSAYFAERPETGLFVKATPASLGGGAAAQTPVRHDRVRTSALSNTNYQRTEKRLTYERT